MKVKLDTAEDAVSVIVQELDSLAINKKVTGSSYMIQCPFHDDNTPSGGINLASGTVPIGYYHCLGCGTKGPWNMLAEKLGLKKLKKWQMQFSSSNQFEDEKIRRLFSTPVDEEARLQQALNSKEMIAWPITENWRGYEGSAVRENGGLMYRDGRTGEIMLFFPIKINGELKGGVRAYLKKKKGRTSYLTTSGDEWVKSSGLMGYDITKKRLKERKKKIVLAVEGPRDYMRLFVNNIPALGFLGANTVSKKKMMKVAAIADTVLVLSDNDKGGDIMYKNIKEASKGVIEVKRLKLPSDYDEDGKLIKVDPHSAPQEIIDEIASFLK